MYRRIRFDWGKWRYQIALRINLSVTQEEKNYSKTKGIFHDGD